jgi:hypothetical protein
MRAVRRTRMGLLGAAIVIALALPVGVRAADGPHYVVPPGFVRCPAAKAAAGFYKWASVEHTTCRVAAGFMGAYARAAAAGPMPRRLRGYRCAIRYWRNADGDIYASRHACRRGSVAIRFYGMA